MKISRGRTKGQRFRNFQLFDSNMFLTKTLLFFLFVGTLVHAQDQIEIDSMDFNSVIDKIIVSARKALVLAKEDSLSLPDFTEDFYQKMWPFVIHGHLDCTRGSVRSLASVKRTGDAKLGFKDSKMMVTIPLGLEELVINYIYDASILHFGATGNLTASVESNSVTLVVEISFTHDGCRLKMDEAKITQFGPVKVTLTGLYPFDGLSSAFAEKAADSLHDTIKQAVEQKLQKRLQKVIDKFPCPRFVQVREVREIKN